MKYWPLGLLGVGLASWLWLRRPRRTVTLKGKVIVVTGASRGLGRALALRAAHKGMRVVLVAPASEAEHLVSVQRELETPGVIVHCDITRASERELLVKTCLEQFGRIDVLVNNAGVGDGGAIRDMPPATLSKIIAVNVDGAFRLTQLVVPVMRQQHAGHIVFISSAVAALHLPGVAAYAASKAAIAAFADSLAAEEPELRVTTLFPAVVRTDMTAKALDNFMKHAAGPAKLLTPLARNALEPKDIAPIILDAIRRSEREVWPGGITVALPVLLAKLWPGLLGRLFRWGSGSIISVTSKLGG